MAKYLRKYFVDTESGERFWHPREADELIEVYGSHYYLFGVMRSDEDVWILVASAMQRRGIEVTAKQVMKKWSRMRHTIHNINAANSKRVPLKLTCPNIESRDYKYDSLARQYTRCHKCERFKKTYYL